MRTLKHNMETKMKEFTIWAITVTAILVGLAGCMQTYTPFFTEDMKQCLSQYKFENNQEEILDIASDIDATGREALSRLYDVAGRQDTSCTKEVFIQKYLDSVEAER